MSEQNKLIQNIQNSEHVDLMFNKKIRLPKIKITKNMSIFTLVIVIVFCFIYYKNQSSIYRRNLEKENKIIISENYKYERKINKMLNITYLDLKEKIRDKFYKDISKIINKNIDNIKTISFTTKIKFGNSLIALNNAIFYCETVGCENIIVEPENWYISKSLYIKEKNITILPNKKIDCLDKGIVCIKTEDLYLYKHKYCLPTLNIKYLKDEIYSNLPKIENNSNYLYIYLRNDDIFEGNDKDKSYALPPFCFYQKIIENNLFEKIIIFSNGKKNLVIQKLINTYPDKKIIFNSGDIKKDFSELMHAKNLVLLKTSFSLEIIRISKYVENIWMFNMADSIENSHWFIDEDITDDKRFNKYIMNPSQYYLDNIYSLKEKKGQLQLMLDEKCDNNFIKK